ncbi:MAG: hypothetical protein OEW83_00470 [Acidimicrobiia bacterium]|nr:hypothetical protein [Acidimicrobiia bacterium]
MTNTETSGAPVTVPYRFEPDTTSAELRAAYDHIDDGAETGVKATVAGRLMLRRVQGKLAFGTLQDSGGRIQLFAPAKVTPDFDESCRSATGSGSRAR